MIMTFNHSYSGNENAPIYIDDEMDWLQTMTSEGKLVTMVFRFESILTMSMKMASFDRGRVV